MRLRLDPENLKNGVEDFVTAVYGWFDTLGSLPKTVWGIDEMHVITEKLYVLCKLAHDLPEVKEVEYEVRDSDDVLVTNKWACKLTRPGIDFEEKYRHYYALFWPYDGTGESDEQPDIPVMGDLVDDIYDISKDLGVALYYYEHDMVYMAVYTWWSRFSIHWGEHASQALYAMDHAIRKYTKDYEEDKYSDTADAMYYPTIPYDDIDGFFVVQVEPYETGLPYQILIDSLGKDEEDFPMIGVAVDGEVIFMSVAKQPKNLSRRSFEGGDQVKAWIHKYHKPLKQHWKRKLTDLEVLNAVSKP